MDGMMPNQFLTQRPGNDPDLWKTKTLTPMRKGFQSKAFSFQYGDQLTAVQNVYNEYQTSVEYGFVDPETGIAEMNDKMMTAGLQKIIEKKAQLAAWQEATEIYRINDCAVQNRTAQVVTVIKRVMTGCG